MKYGTCFLVAAVVLSAVYGVSQQSSGLSTVLNAPLGAMGTQSPPGLLLSGRASSWVGSTEDDGSFQALCTAGGSSQLHLQASSGELKEDRETSNGVAVGTWTDQLGNSHAIASHNLFSPESWFCPSIQIARFMAGNSLAIASNGQESKDGALVEHLVLSQPQSGADQASKLLSHLTEVHLCLDAHSALPLYLEFNIHPDKTASVDIPVKVKFANFTKINGMLLPMTVEKYVNSSLSLRLQVQSVIVGQTPLSN